MGVTLAPRFSPHLVGSQASGKQCSDNWQSDMTGADTACLGTSGPGASAVGAACALRGVCRPCRRRAAHRELGRHLCRARQGDGQDFPPRGAAQPDRATSARSRSRRAPATRARRPSRPRPPPSSRSTRRMLDGKEKRIFSGWMFADSPGPQCRRASGVRRLADRLRAAARGRAEGGPAAPAGSPAQQGAPRAAAPTDAEPRRRRVPR